MSKFGLPTNSFPHKQEGQINLCCPLKSWLPTNSFRHRQQDEKYRKMSKFGLPTNSFPNKQEHQNHLHCPLKSWMPTKSFRYRQKDQKYSLPPTTSHPASQTSTHPPPDPCTQTVSGQLVGALVGSVDILILYYVVLCCTNMY